MFGCLAIGLVPSLVLVARHGAVTPRNSAVRVHVQTVEE